jgi:hypothetical protein
MPSAGNDTFSLADVNCDVRGIALAFNRGSLAEAAP